MNETVYINWLLPVSHFMWILGASVLLSAFSVAFYVNRGNRSDRSGNIREYIKQPLFQWTIWCSAFLLLMGVILYQFKLPSDKLVVVKIAADNTGKPLMQLDDIPMSLTPGALRIDPQNRSHPLNNEKMKDNTIALFWDGFVSTPFMRFPKGKYRFDFYAKGTKAENEFAKIKVEFESPDKLHYLHTRKKVYITLNNKMSRYIIFFQTQQDTVGRVRITYFNDVQIANTYKGRDVWLRGVSVSAVK